MKNKKNTLLLIGIFLILIGALLPAIRIAQENINFIKENGILILILISSMLILLKLNYKQLLYIPSILSIIIIIKFITDNKERLNQINQIYNCYASYEYGLLVMIIGNIIILATITYQYLNINKIKNTTKIIKTKALENKNTLVIKTQLFKEKIHDKNIEHQTTKDGMIKYNKITVKCEKPLKYKEKITFKQKLQEFIKKIRIRRKKLSISKYKEENVKVYKVPVIDIKKWTRSNVCCSNCGATVHTTSEYCFLCDCKIKLNQEQEKYL